MKDLVKNVENNKVYEIITEDVSPMSNPNTGQRVVIVRDMAGKYLYLPAVDLITQFKTVVGSNANWKCFLGYHNQEIFLGRDNFRQVVTYQCSRCSKIHRVPE